MAVHLKALARSATTVLAQHIQVGTWLGSANASSRQGGLIVQYTAASGQGNRGFASTPSALRQQGLTPIPASSVLRTTSEKPVCPTKGQYTNFQNSVSTWNSTSGPRLTPEKTKSKKPKGKKNSTKTKKSGNKTKPFVAASTAENLDQKLFSSVSKVTAARVYGDTVKPSPRGEPHVRESKAGNKIQDIHPHIQVLARAAKRRSSETNTFQNTFNREFVENLPKMGQSASRKYNEPKQSVESPKSEDAVSKGFQNQEDMKRSRLRLIHNDMEAKGQVSQLANEMGDWLSSVRHLMAKQEAGEKESLQVKASHSKPRLPRYKQKTYWDTYGLEQREGIREGTTPKLKTIPKRNVLSPTRKPIKSEKDKDGCLEIHPKQVSNVPFEHGKPQKPDEVDVLYEEAMSLIRPKKPVPRTDQLRTAGCVVLNENDEEVPLSKINERDLKDGRPEYKCSPSLIKKPYTAPTSKGETDNSVVVFDQTKRSAMLKDDDQSDARLDGLNQVDPLTSSGPKEFILVDDNTPRVDDVRTGGKGFVNRSFNEDHWTKDVAKPFRTSEQEDIIEKTKTTVFPGFQTGIKDTLTKSDKPKIWDIQVSPQIGISSRDSVFTPDLRTRFPTGEITNLTSNLKPGEVISWNTSNSSMMDKTTRASSGPRLFVRPEEIVSSTGPQHGEGEFLGKTSTVSGNDHVKLAEEQLLKRSDATDYGDIEMWSRRLTQRMNEINSRANIARGERPSTGKSDDKPQMSEKQFTSAMSNQPYIKGTGRSTKLAQENETSEKSVSEAPDVKSAQQSVSRGKGSAIQQTSVVGAKDQTLVPNGVEIPKALQFDGKVAETVSGKTMDFKHKRDLSLIQDLRTQWMKAFKENFLQMGKTGATKQIKDLALASSTNMKIGNSTASTKYHNAYRSNNMSTPSSVINRYEKKVGKESTTFNASKKASNNKQGCSKAEKKSSKMSLQKGVSQKSHGDRDGKNTLEDWVYHRDVQHLQESTPKKPVQRVHSWSPGRLGSNVPQEGTQLKKSKVDEIINELKYKKRIDAIMKGAKDKQKARRDAKVLSTGVLKHDHLNSPSTESKNPAISSALHRDIRETFLRSDFKNKSRNNQTFYNTTPSRGSPKPQATAELLASARNDVDKMMALLNSKTAPSSPSGQGFRKPLTALHRDYLASPQGVSNPLDGLATMTITPLPATNDDLEKSFSDNQPKSRKKKLSKKEESPKAPREFGNLSAALGINGKSSSPGVKGRGRKDSEVRPQLPLTWLDSLWSGDDLRASLVEKRQQAALNARKDLIISYRRKIKKLETALQKDKGRLRKFEERQRKLEDRKPML